MLLSRTKMLSSLPTTLKDMMVSSNMGYQLPRRYSAKGCPWLSSLDGNMRHAWNGVEVTLGPYTVDGYDEESGKVYKFYRCYWHGCPDCYPNLATSRKPIKIYTKKPSEEPKL
jgi:hypothetical protein